MATKEPLRRCVRCKTKKKGCSRGSPCERCAMAGLTADECIYIESDATFRGTKPKRKDTTPLAPKMQLTKISRTLSGPGKDANAVVRCSRCIRTARGCSHERPCQPCKEGGLSEWECRYTSASSFKVRGPGTRNLRKVKSMERLPTITTTLSTTLDDSAIRRVLKTERSHSTNSAPTAFAQDIIDRIPRDYRTPSPPTNISPISEPPDWRDVEETTSPVRVPGTIYPAGSPSLRVHRPDVSSPTAEASLDDSVAIAAESDVPVMCRTTSTSGLFAVGSLEPPSIMSLLPSRSQQSHANTFPDSSPVVYTDDYQSSPSPFNSPQFASSPPSHFAQLSNPQRPSSYPLESGLFASHVQYRPPTGFPRHGHSRQMALSSSSSQQGFAIQQTTQAQQLQMQMQQQQQQYQQTWSYANSPPYPQYQQLPHFAGQAHMIPQQVPRHRAVPSPAPRYATGPSPYAIPSRQSSHESRQQAQTEQHRRTDQTFPQAIPARPGSQQRRIESYNNNQSVSSKDGSPARYSIPTFKANLQRYPSHDSNGDYESGIFEQESNWQDSEVGIFRQDEHL